MPAPKGPSRPQPATGLDEDVAGASREQKCGLAGWTGLEPATSDVTGRRSNQLNYHPAGVHTGSF